MATITTEVLDLEHKQTAQIRQVLTLDKMKRTAQIRQVLTLDKMKSEAWLSEDAEAMADRISGSLLPRDQSW